MRQSPSHFALCAACLLAVVPLPSAVFAQQGAVTFKNFHRYPNGQWQQQGQGSFNGGPMSPMETSTTCSGPLSAAQADAIKQLGNSLASQCTWRVITDTESLAESEQTCALPGGTQVNHMTMHAVDDKTIREETRMSLNGRLMSETRVTTRYQGTCTPSAAAVPAMPKPSAEDCKQIAEMKQQSAEGAKVCAQLPAANRASCEAAMLAGAKQVEALSAACR